jgi:serine O-acetyltransferase
MTQGQNNSLVINTEPRLDEDIELPSFYNPGVFRSIREDISTILERDPAAHSTLEVVLCYSGQHAVWAHRLTHRLWQRNFRLLARWIAQCIRAITGIEIHPGAKIGRRVFIDHGMGVVIGETAEIGNDVTLYHGVTLGGTSLSQGKRHPSLGDRIVVGAGAKLLGAITIGNDCRIGANSVVVKSVPAHSVVVGIPGQIIVNSAKVSSGDVNNSTDSSLPDALGTALRTLMTRVDQLEKYSGITAIKSPKQDADGTWHSEDFVI